MVDLSAFERFGNYEKKVTKLINNKNVIVYTRVSSKEQADYNLSLETQLKAIKAYANHNGMKILEYFGGTYESAKTDGRKEFQRMLEFIKKRKGEISHILVY